MLNHQPKQTRDLHNYIGKPKCITKKGRSQLVECTNIGQANSLRNVANLRIFNKDVGPLPKTKGTIAGSHSMSRMTNFYQNLKTKASFTNAEL